VLAAVYGWFDVRHRARVDRGPRYHRTDLTVYQAAAAALVDGTDPYEAENPRGWRYVYPPLPAIALMPFARWSPPDLALLWYALSMGCLVFSFGVLVRTPRPGAARTLGLLPVAVGAFVCLGFGHQGFQRGQITWLLLALHLAAWALLTRRRFAGAGLLLALGGALRLTPWLASGAIGLGLLLRVRGAPGPFVRFSAGTAAGLVLGLVALPVLVLGPARAWEVSARWWERTQAIQGAGEGVDLKADYRIDEYRFKNQAPRRVARTWAGWASGSAFDDEQPLLDEAVAARADGVATAIAWLGLLLAAALGARRLGGPFDGRAALAFALVTWLPFVMGRYAWPTHAVFAWPALALLAGSAVHRRLARGTVLVVLVATVLFYAAHAPVLEPIGQAGPLLLASLFALGTWGVLLLRRPRAGRAEGP
jgi:hypothetical protein